MEEKKVKVFVSGCTGRMGKLVVEAVNQHPGWEVCGGFGLGEHPYDFPVFDIGDSNCMDFFRREKPNIGIDFSSAGVSEWVFINACRYKIPFVFATTKLSEELIRDMKKQTAIPVFQAYNLAYDVYAFTQAVASLVAKLPGCDIDIIEIHHKGKKDAPSGTALNLANAINRALGETHTIICNPQLDGLRGPNEIHIHSERKGSYAGTHIVTLTVANAYTIELKHEAFSPKIFADGAIKAAEFLLAQPAGYYNMDNL